MYKASINEQQLSGSIQMVLIKSIIFLFFCCLRWKGVATAVSEHVGFYLQARAQAHRGNEKKEKREAKRKKDIFRFHVALIPTGLKM